MMDKCENISTDDQNLQKEKSLKFTLKTKLS